MFGKIQSKEEAPLDPARARLAAAIVERDEAQAKADAAKASVERASGLVEEAAARLSSTVAALADRRKEAAGRVLEAAVAGGAGCLPYPTRGPCGRFGRC